MEYVWGFITIGGPIILGAVLLYGVIMTLRSRGQTRITEQATRRNKEQAEHEAAVDPSKVE